ncbi:MULTISPECIES: MarR family transcriptional regulator [unclassified Rhizobium]|uniref:MarR family winged helix-turn-helix transcriptional regulator n=1 Tax=unclassified Rhizobium TaxID=2613769 RepID=UPI000DD33A32|nr:MULTISPECIES: MarR family transcriptional regulator [unclassified Rhizobium]MBB3386914.1 DNA-binding MarR family transcriptional regulator [Rhizobium sp. BK098]MBB3571540.1 DNA-binding MarR family transcriptional regulator [Rhizobium sp. BK491]MBB3618567.1 DNA-binding MarR family transcriptional regulator [Rhizobium sp. BK609]MBB3684259.1 DNA-binding MarR family transcriptional regulator [Rhizobium sp. BK612]
MMDWDLFDTPAPLINMASRAFSRLGERRVRALGFNIGQLPVLYLLRNGAQMSQKDLAKFAKIEQPSMAQMLARMERDGLIRRTPDPADGRSSLVSLTEAAVAKLPAARQALEEGRDRVLSGFSADEVQTLVQLMRRLNQNLDRMVAEEDGS